ncbi:MAG: cache domain-containing protein [Desulfosarcinaceae bacterium]
MRWFSDLRIRYKLLVSYATVFALSMSLGSYIIYTFVRQTITAGIESELENSTNTILNMVRTAADVSIRNHLRAVAENNRDIAKALYQRVLAGEISEAAAKAVAGRMMLSQTIGKTGYIYCINSAGRIVIHPEKALLGADLSRFDFIREQKARKIGYLEYDWQNPGEDHPRPKALYMIYFEPWDWIISASSYRSEFRQLIDVKDFEEGILSLTFGQTGYSFIMDSKGNLVLHPALEGNYYDAQDRKGHYFIKEICQRKSGKITYPWENPGEKTPREKLVIFNYIPEFDWIVASSSYLDEFYAPLKVVRSLIVATVVIFMLLVLPITLRLSSSITHPLRELMQRFAKGARGDISVRMQRRSNDEIGHLARYFNIFMERLEAYSIRLQNIIDSMPSILVGVDRDGRVTLWNREAERITRLTSQAALGRPVAEVLPHLQENSEQVRLALDKQQATTLEKVAFRDAGRLTYLNIMIYPLTVDQAAGAVIRVDDVTDRVRLENTMVQTEKMMSVGGLAAGMAHEINNPLGGILQSLQNIQRRLSNDLPQNHDTAEACGTHLAAIRGYLERRRVLRFLDSIRVSGERASHIVQNMLSFSRRSEARKRPVSLERLLDKSIELAAHDYDLRKKFDFRDIRIVRVYDADLPEVPCVATEIEQVVLNLLRNAAQAMTATVQARPPEIVLTTRRHRDQAVVSIADNGPGIPADLRSRVFEPFFTTKDVGIGTGLGLSVSYFIVTSHHGGRLSVESESGKGSCFTISLPLEADAEGFSESDSPPAITAAPAPRPGHEERKVS